MKASRIGQDQDVRMNRAERESHLGKGSPYLGLVEGMKLTVAAVDDVRVARGGDELEPRASRKMKPQVALRIERAKAAQCGFRAIDRKTLSRALGSRLIRDDRAGARTDERKACDDDARE